MKIIAAAFSIALGMATNAQEPRSIKYTAGGSQIIITDLGLLPGGTTSAGLTINDQPLIIGLATDSNLELQRPFWNANTGDIVGFADNFDPAATAVPEHLNNNLEMTGTEVISSGRLFRGIYWNPAGWWTKVAEVYRVETWFPSRCDANPMAAPTDCRPS